MAQVGVVFTFILPDLRGGGAERIHLLLAREFLERGYAVDFVLMRATGELLEEVPIGAKVVDLRVNRFRQGFWPLVKYLRERKPAGVVAAMWPLSGIASLAVRISGEGPALVVSEHNTLTRDETLYGLSDFVHRRFGKYVYGKHANIVAVSKGVASDLAHRIGVSEKKVNVIYNPVARPASKIVGQTSVTCWWNAGADKIISIGSFKAQKDYGNLLRAFARLAQTHDARLLILGEGPLRGELEALVDSLGIHGRVMMPGFARDPFTYLDEADLFVLSSAWEGLGNVVIEALVAGVPVVSTDCPSGPAEILENGKYGRLVPVGDPEALAVAMAEALHAPHDRDMLRRRGNEFSVERAADQYLALLDPGGKRLAGK